MTLSLHSPAWLAVRTSLEKATLNGLAKLGLAGWRVEFRHTIVYAGRCDHETKTILYSVPFMLYATVEQRLATIAHEIAHAFRGPGHGHDETWSELCVKLGGTGKSISEYPQELFTHKNFAWIGVCPSCSRRTGDFNAPVDVWGCPECVDAKPLDRVYQWFHNGEPRDIFNITPEYENAYRKFLGSTVVVSASA